MLNKWYGIGNLGKDPEVTYTPAGMRVCKFSIATEQKWKDKTTNEYVTKTEWINVVAFGKLAEICGEYLHKGKQVFIEGRMQTSSWEKDGVTRYNTEIIASEMKMLGGHRQEEKPPEPTPKDDDIPF